MENYISDEEYDVTNEEDCIFYWVRIYDYRYSDELKTLADESSYNFEKYKGVLIDEYYVYGIGMTREEAKSEVVKRSDISRFAKARNNGDCRYCLILSSNKFFYDRFYKTYYGYCFNPDCRKIIHGKAKDFIKVNYERLGTPHDEAKKLPELYFCSFDCRNHVENKILNINDYGEWQEREGSEDNGGVCGYIYHIFNKKTMKHYIGQTKYMPFFRWQEHVKSKLKGDICDLVFDTIAEIRYNNKEYIDNIEAWWINKYIDEYGRDMVMNIDVPKITISDLIYGYTKM